MEDILYGMAMVFAEIHEKILDLNNHFEYYLSDKQLHFIVMGLLGMAMIFVLYPFFKWLARKGHMLVVTFLYVFTLIIVIAFAVEIGQWATGTGSMESGDIGYGILGFLVMFGIYAIIRGICRAVKKAVKNVKRAGRFTSYLK